MFLTLGKRRNYPNQRFLRPNSQLKSAMQTSMVFILFLDLDAIFGNAGDSVFCTYDNNAKVQNGPHTGEVFSKTQ